MTDAEILTVARQPGTTPSRDEYIVVTDFTLNGRPDYLSVLYLRGAEDSLRILEHHAYP